MTRAAEILLVDDQSLYREGLAELINKWDEFRVVGNTGDGRSAVEFCARLHPSIVLMDVKMPVMDGIEACREIKGRWPETAVIMLSLYGEKERVLAAIANGANGYLLKSIHAQQLRSKLLSVLNGGAVLSDEVAAICLDALRRPSFVPLGEEETRKMISSLTEHEIELLRLIADGHPNKDIADRLYLGESTVKKQVSFLLTKLNLSNRVQAAVFALRSGIAD